MQATETRGANLAVRRIPQQLEPRLEHRRRLVAFAELFSDAPRKPKAVYNVTRTEPRAKLYDERQRQVIHDGIRAGEISPERAIRFRLFQMQDDLAQFGEAPMLEELLYVQLIREQAEALEAQSVLRALPTPANRDAAIRETEQASTIGRVFCALARQGRALFHGVRA